MTTTLQRIQFKPAVKVVFTGRGADAADIMSSLYTAPYTGAVPIPARIHLDHVVSVANFLTGSYNDSADHTDWIQGAIDAVGADFGGANIGILFPHPVYNISDTLRIRYDHMHLLGRGHGIKRGTPSDIRESAATRFFFKDGATPAPLLEWAPLDGGKWPVLGGGLRNIMLDGNNRATRSLSILSTWNLDIENIQAYASTEAMILTSQIDGTLTKGVYGSAYHQWRNVQAHTQGYNDNTAYALRLVGHRGEGGEDPDNSTINQFYHCRFVSMNNHAVRMENADGHDFWGGSMRSFVGGGTLDSNGMGVGFFALELCSEDQTGNGVARTNRFWGVQINDVIMRASQSSDPEASQSPYDNEFYGNNFGNAGGQVFAETQRNLGTVPHAVVYDSHNGITVFGHGRNGVNVYQLHGVDRIHMIDGVDIPATESGYAKEFVDVGDGSRKIKFGDGTLRVLAPKGNVMAQAISPGEWPDGAGALAGTLTNSPLAGNPTKWIPINDNGIIRYIPTW